MIKYSNLKKAFTLVELIIVIAIITLLAGITITTIQPQNIFANSRNGQRSNDISNINSAIIKYLADSTISQTRKLSDFTGYDSLVSSAAIGQNICPNGISGTGLTTLSTFYKIDTSGSNIINITLLINNGYLPKVPKDPLSGTDYQVCIDTVNNSQLVIYAGNSENITPPTIAINVPTPSTGMSYGLSAYWNMDETSGINVSDSSSFGNNGTATGTSIISGKFTNARSFNGTSSDYISVPDSTYLKPKAVSFGGWVNPQLTGGNQWIIEKNTTYELIVSYAGNPNGSNKITYAIANTSPGWSFRNTNVSLLPGWQHIMVTYDGVTEKLYQNGSLVYSQSGSGNINTGLGGNLSLGYSVGSSGNYYKGALDDIRIYNRALSSNEIYSLYNLIPGS